MAATLADITCDSDGKLDRFVSAREGVDFDPILPLHELQPGKKYYLGMFLTGVYQEVMGSSHNMLGAPHAVHVRLQDTASAAGAPPTASSVAPGYSANVSILMAPSVAQRRLHAQQARRRVAPPWGGAAAAGSWRAATSCWTA